MSLSPSQNQPILNDDQKEALLSLYWRSGLILNQVFRISVELNLFEVISKEGPEAELSAAEIASHLPTQNGQAPEILDRMLHLLASHSIVKCTNVSDKNGRITRLYGLNPLSKCFVPGEEGASRAPVVEYFFDREISKCWDYFKDAVLEGGSPFQRANEGKNLFQILGSNNKLRLAFNEAMHSMATVFMREILESYKGFENLKEIVDIGGGIGTTLKMIVAKYPWIRGINFDLPQVIKDAPIVPGVHHVEGDMFKSVPKGEAIMMQRVLHNWSDEQCLKILKNCYNALPDSGKVIIIEMILPETSASDISSKVALGCHVAMFIMFPGGRERTELELETLAKGAGFATSKVVCRTYELSVLEFHKS